MAPEAVLQRLIDGNKKYLDALKSGDSLSMPIEPINAEGGQKPLAIQT